MWNPEFAWRLWREFCNNWNLPLCVCQPLTLPSWSDAWRGPSLWASANGTRQHVEPPSRCDNTEEEFYNKFHVSIWGLIKSHPCITAGMRMSRSVFNSLLWTVLGSFGRLHRWLSTHDRLFHAVHNATTTACTRSGAITVRRNGFHSFLFLLTSIGAFTAEHVEKRGTFIRRCNACKISMKLVSIHKRKAWKAYRES